MELTVKTLKGEKFTVAVEESNTIEEVKGLIENARSDLPAAGMKLIYTGKVLKDTQTIAECELKPNAFLVVMITKAKKAATPTAQSTVDEAESKPAAVETATSDPVAEILVSENAAASVPSPAAVAPSSSSTDDVVSPEAVSQLMAMGFPEPEVRACLRAANGNADVAVEFLMNGIPDYIQEAPSSTSVSAAPASVLSSSEPLSQLRNHPQINQLRLLVQQNPSTLQAVLTQIGQQQPELLQEINVNQELFLQIMNEPVVEGSLQSTSGTETRNLEPSIANVGESSNDSAASRMDEMMEGLGNPAQMMRMIQGMNPEELQGMAAMMGLTPEQLQATAQAIGNMDPHELEHYFNMAMQAEGQMPSGAEGGGGGQILRLTEEELAAVDRLASMGFDRTEAAQAYIACDKNEELAANLLMDGGFGFGGGDNPLGEGDDDNDMYD